MSPPAVVSVGEFARRVKLTPRHVARLIKWGLPVQADGRIVFAVGRRWLRARRRRTAGQARERLADQLGLLRARTAACWSRVARLRAEWIETRDWAPQFGQMVEAVRRILVAWAAAAAPALEAILAADGPRLFPGTDGRAVGAAVQEYVARPLLEELAAACEGWDALPPPAAPPRVRRAATVADARRALAEARTVELQLRTAIGADPRWRRRAAVETELAERVARGRSELWDGLPGRVVREVRQTDGPRAVAAIVAATVDHALAALGVAAPAPVVIGPAPSTNGTRHILKEALP
jgi:hypothetical protein